MPVSNPPASPRPDKFTIGFGDPTGGFLPNFGWRVTKVGDVSAAPDDLFTVTGKCMITMFVGEVTSVIATTTSLQLQTSTGSVIIATSTQITTDAVGTLYFVTGDPDDALNGAQTPNVDIAFTKTGFNPPILMNDDKIYQAINGAGTGLIQWDLYYFPLESGALIAASA